MKSKSNRRPLHRVGSSGWIAELEAAHDTLESLRKRAEKSKAHGMVEWHLNCARNVVMHAAEASRGGSAIKEISEP